MGWTFYNSSGQRLTSPAATSGKVLQAATAEFTGTQTITTDDDTFTDVTSLSVAITPSATNSKVLVLVCIGKVDANSDANTAQFIVLRDSTRIAVGTDTNSRIAASFTMGVGGANGNGGLHFSTLDSPSTTSSVTYKVGASCHNTDVYINKWRTDTNNDDGPSARTASSITVMEIAA